MSAGVILGLLLLCCVLAWFVGVPRLRDQMADDLGNVLSTEVADQLTAGTGGGLEPGTYTLSVAEMRQELEQNVDTSGTEDFDISVDSQGMAISFTSGNQEFGYTGMPVARDGRLVMDNMEVTNDFLGWVMPADRLGEAIEDGINAYFVEQGLRIDAVELGQDELVFTVSGAGT
jgi:hypothetical protein